jgi:hypothetical protein
MNPAQYPLNHFAPSYFQGANIDPSIVYDPKPYTYLYNVTMTAFQAILGDSVSIEVDADFLLLGWYISAFTGVFEIQLLDSSGYQLFSGYLNSAAISQASSDPTVFSPAHPFPAGGRIQVNIGDASGAGNTVQIAFVGMKLFRRKPE